MISSMWVTISYNPILDFKCFKGYFMAELYSIRLITKEEDPQGGKY
jgi:hypothetical protein